MQLRGLCWRSWEQIRVYVGGLGSGSGPMWAVFGADQGLLDGLGNGSGPMWAVLGADQGKKWPKPEHKDNLGRDQDRKVV